MIYHRHAPFYLLTFVLTLGTMCMLASCGIGLAQQDGQLHSKYAPPPSSFPLYFDSSVSYDDALRAVTDLGLQPSLECGYEDDVKAGRVITNMQWQPTGQRAIFMQEHRLFVALTPLAPPDWTTRIKLVPGLLPYRQEDASQPHYCPNGSVGWGATPVDSGSASPTSLDTSGPPPTVLDYAQAASSPITRVVFAPSTTYDEALYTISNLSLRLADPCYERAQAANYPTPTPWPGAGAGAALRGDA